MAKRKNAAAQSDAPSPKKSKVATSATIDVPTRQSDDDGNSFWSISLRRRVVVSNYKGQTFLNIREFYEKDGKHLPGKSGIALNAEQVGALVSALPDIVKALSEKGFELPGVTVTQSEAQDQKASESTSEESDHDSAETQSENGDD